MIMNWLFLTQAYNEALGVNYLMNSTHVAKDLKRKFRDDQQHHQFAVKDQEAPDEDDAETRFMRYIEGKRIWNVIM